MTLLSGCHPQGFKVTVNSAELASLGLVVEIQEVAPGRPNVVGTLEGRAAGVIA